jgi:glycosyl transferase family 25
MHERLRHGVSVYVINLDRSQDRLEKISLQLEQLDFPFQRISAVDGKTATHEQNQLLNLSLYKKRHGKFPTPGELGCYLSHYEAVSMASLSENEFTLVLEDDAILGTGLAGTINDLVSIPDTWDFVKLSGVHSGTPICVMPLPRGKSLSVLLTKCTGASAYLLNRKASIALREGLLPMSLPIDHEFDKGWIYKFQVRAVIPFPVKHNTEAESTIGNSTKSLKLPSRQRIPTHIYRLITEIRRLVYGLGQIVRSLLQN